MPTHRRRLGRAMLAGVIVGKTVATGVAKFARAALTSFSGN
jgi:hypothetical protein